MKTLKNISLITISSLCFTHILQSCDYTESPFLIPSELSQKNENSFSSFIAPSPDNQTSSVTTAPHRMTPFKMTPLDLAEDSIEPITNGSKIIQIKGTRYLVSSKPADISPNWRQDSFIPANQNGENISILPTKNELLFQKTYLAAALRGMLKKEPLRIATKTKEVKYYHAFVSKENSLDNIDELPIKDCRSKKIILHVQKKPNVL